MLLVYPFGERKNFKSKRHNNICKKEQNGYMIVYAYFMGTILSCSTHSQEFILLDEVRKLILHQEVRYCE